MTRILYQGVPVWKNPDGAIYYYDTVSDPPLQIGTLSEGLDPRWKALLSAALSAYRNAQTPRGRGVGAAAAAARKN